VLYSIVKSAFLITAEEGSMENRRMYTSGLISDLLIAILLPICALGS